MKVSDENEAVANVLFTTGPTDTSATAKLCLIYRFFDCLNVRSTEEDKLNRRNFLSHKTMSMMQDLHG